MTTMNATQARKNFYKLMEEVNENSTPVTVTNKNGKNIVMIGEDDWNALQETLYLNSIPGMVDSIYASNDENIDDMQTYDPDEEW